MSSWMLALSFAASLAAAPAASFSRDAGRTPDITSVGQLQRGPTGVPAPARTFTPKSATSLPSSFSAPSSPAPEAPQPGLACLLKKRPWTVTAAWFAAGATSAFVAHELGHVTANLLAGNVPHLVGLKGLGVVPFFAISPEIRCSTARCIGAQGQPFPGGRRGQYQIAAAGFEVQHFANEIILGRTPHLRQATAPMQKGWLAFNLALSVGYALASLAGVEDSHGDAGGVAYHAQVPRGLVAALLVAPAALDGWRYFRPQDNWAPWASRAGKLGLVGLAFRI